MAIQHYEGKLGVFDYDDEMYEVQSKMDYDESLYDVLKFKDAYVGPISLPKGIVSTREMFLDCTIKPGCYLEDFDTSNVVDMRYMFGRCVIPNGFTLGDNFDTFKVQTMKGMFSGCDLPKGFMLGDKFNTTEAYRSGLEWSDHSTTVAFRDTTMNGRSLHICVDEDRNVSIRQMSKVEEMANKRKDELITPATEITLNQGW